MSHGAWLKRYISFSSLAGTVALAAVFILIMCSKDPSSNDLQSGRQGASDRSGDKMVGRVGGVVLCGGMSHRMGRAKAWLPIEDETMLQRVVGIVRGVVDPVVVVGRREQSLPPLPDGTLLAHDLVDGVGPLAGLAAGFEALGGKCDAAFVVACDQPLLKPDFIRRMIQLLGDEPAVAVEHDGFVHPLTAVYRLDTSATLKALLAKGERRAQLFFTECGGQCLLAAALADVDQTLCSLQNANDEAAYERMLASCRTNRRRNSV